MSTIIGLGSSKSVKSRPDDTKLDVTVFNEYAEMTDNAIVANADNITALTTDISKINSKITTLQNADNSINNAISNADNRIQTLEETKLEINEKLDTVNSKLSEMQLFKFPNVTIFGTPTINNGQVSNFNSTNYLQFPFVVDFKNRPFEIEMHFTVGDDEINQQNIFDSQNGLAFAIRNKRFVFAYSDNGTSWSNEFLSDEVVHANLTYIVKLIWNENQWSLVYSTDGGTTNNVAISGNGNAPYPKQIIIGKSLDNSHVFGGIINLNNCKLTISDKVVWTGMDDAGLATRMAVDMSNIDDAGKTVINNMIDEKIDNALETRIAVDMSNIDDAGKSVINNMIDEKIGDIDAALQNILGE